MNRATTGSAPEASAAAPIDFLRRTAAPDVVVHIGAGRGVGDMHVWRQWPVGHALLIDADDKALQWAAAGPGLASGWHARQAVLAGHDGSANYYHASNPTENGLLAPAALTALWPNLRTIAQCEVPVQRLDTLLGADAALAPLLRAQCGWLVIECLAAGAILAGAANLLGRCDVVWLRVLLKPVPDLAAADSTLDAVQALLASHGFLPLCVGESHHPGIGNALFMRDRQARLRSMADEQQDLLARNDGWAAECQTLRTDAEGLTDMLARLDQQRRQEQLQLLQLSAERDALESERDQHKLVAAERHALLTDQHAELTRRHAQLTERHAQLAQAKQEKAALQSELAACRDRLQAGAASIARLEAALAEREVRQRLMDDEIIKAEAQVAFIKDLLLREPEL